MYTCTFTLPWMCLPPYLPVSLPLPVNSSGYSIHTSALSANPVYPICIFSRHPSLFCFQIQSIMHYFILFVFSFLWPAFSPNVSLFFLSPKPACFFHSSTLPSSFIFPFACFLISSLIHSSLLHLPSFLSPLIFASGLIDLVACEWKCHARGGRRPKVLLGRRTGQHLNNIRLWERFKTVDIPS